MTDELTLYKSIGVVKNRARWQSEQLLTFTATRPCSVANCRRDATVHHLVRGRRVVSSDLLVIPLCLQHHMELDHELSDREFEQRYRLNLWYLFVRNVELFLESMALDSPTKVEHKRVNRGTAKSRGNPGRGIAPLTKTCNTKPIQT